VRGVCVHTKETLLGDSPRFGAKTHITGTHAVANNNLSSSHTLTYVCAYIYIYISHNTIATTPDGGAGVDRACALAFAFHPRTESEN